MHIEYSSFRAEDFYCFHFKMWCVHIRGGKKLAKPNSKNVDGLPVLSSSLSFFGLDEWKRMAIFYIELYLATVTCYFTLVKLDK